MGKQYQTRDVEASMLGLAIPEEVSVALAEIAESATEGLLALAVGAGLQVLGTLMEESVTQLAGPKGRHNPDRAAVRHGHEHGSVTLGGRRVAVQHPRVRAADGSGELPVAAYELFSQTEVLGRLALERMLGGLSTRRYPVGLEPVGTQATQAASGTSKSAVSRRFVAMTHTALAELLARDLGDLDLVALLVDGVHFGEHCCVVALGIGIDGTKHPLALVEGSTENATLARDLLVGLRERGLDVTQPILVVIDGAKALRRAILDVFDHPVIARCQQHKLRNVRDKLPERLRGPVERRMRTAYHAPSALDAEAQLLTLARELDKTHPGAASSLREGLTETLTVLPAGRPADPGPHVALDQPDREPAVDLPRPRQQCQALAGRHHGAALVRRRDGRGHQAVSPGQRLPAPSRPARRAPSRGHQDCHTHTRGSGGRSGLNITGPPPKFHGTRDILHHRVDDRCQVSVDV
jgi:putative transposase